jgi:hypothetical protein
MSESLNPAVIGRLKDAWRKEFRETRIELTKLQDRLSELKHKLDAADEMLAATSHRPKSGTKYASLGIADGVRAFFTEHRYMPYTISDLTRRLQEEGLPLDSGSARDVVSITCRRLWRKEDFLTSELRNDGMRVFRLKIKNGTNSHKEQAGVGKPTPAVQNTSNE